jgi:hypothetical protein
VQAHEAHVQADSAGSKYTRTDVSKMIEVIASQYSGTGLFPLDRNKFYNSINAIMVDWRKGWSDNPPYFCEQILALLRLCQAADRTCDLFTKNQFDNIVAFCREIENRGYCNCCPYNSRPVYH